MLKSQSSAAAHKACGAAASAETYNAFLYCFEQMRPRAEAGFANPFSTIMDDAAEKAALGGLLPFRAGAFASMAVDGAGPAGYEPGDGIQSASIDG